MAKCLRHIESNKSTLAFGAPAGYSIIGEDVVLSDSLSPRDLGPYYSCDVEKIKQNYIQKFDYVNGMAFMCRRDVLLAYGERLLNKVKYADDVRITFMDDFFIWYETGTGISSGKNSIWIKRLAKDNRECFKIIASDHPQYNYIGKYCFNSDRNIIIRIISKFARWFHERKIMNSAEEVQFTRKSNVTYINEIINKAVL